MSDPIAKLAMTPRNQKEAGIHYLEWKENDLSPMFKTISMVFIFMLFATVLVVSI